MDKLRALIAVFLTTASFMILAAPATAAETSPIQYFSTKINVTDLDRSIAFYSTFVGLTEAARSAGTSPVVEVLMTKSGAKGAATEPAVVLAWQRARKEPLVLGNAFNNITFVVTDIKATVKALEAAGYKITGSPEPRPSPTPAAKQIAVVFTKDPDGYSIELLQRFQ